MYSVDSLDTVIQLRDAPQSDVGAPLPLVVADELRLLLTYLISQPDPNWDGTYVNVVSSDTEGAVAIITFDSPAVHMFGPPNDEAFSGHPLADRGLTPYSVAEIQNSSWLRQMVRMNAVHPQHRDDAFADCRHFIFAFHDSTFECIADGFSVDLFRGSINQALKYIVAQTLA